MKKENQQSAKWQQENSNINALDFEIKALKSIIQDMDANIKSKYSEEENYFIERLISFYWVEYNSEHPNNLKEFELSKSILEKFKKK